MVVTVASKRTAVWKASHWKYCGCEIWWSEMQKLERGMFCAACTLKAKQRGWWSHRSSRRSGRLSGPVSKMWAKDLLSAGSAQQPWQEVSLQTWWSHSYEKHVHPPCTQLIPARNLERWQLWFTSIPLSAPQTETAVSTFPPKHHLRQKTELGSALEGRDGCSSSWNLYKDNSIQMCEILRFIAQKHPPDWDRHFDNTCGIH